MHHKRFQRVVRPFVRRDRLLVKVSVPVPGDRQRQLSKFGFQRAFVRAVAGIARTNAGGIVFVVIQKGRSFGLKQLVDGVFQVRSKDLVHVLMLD
jgi:hypothetical protein